MINGLPFQRSWDARCQIKESLLPVTEVCCESGFTASSHCVRTRHRRRGDRRHQHDEVVAHIVGAA